MEADKVFTFMVIHDLKHPTESILASLKKAVNKIKKDIGTINEI